MYFIAVCCRWKHNFLNPNGQSASWNKNDYTDQLSNSLWQNWDAHEGIQEETAIALQKTTINNIILNINKYITFKK